MSDLQHRLKEVARAVIDYVVANGPCENTDEEDEENGYCDLEGCLYCKLAKSIDRIKESELEETPNETLFSENILLHKTKLPNRGVLVLIAAILEKLSVTEIEISPGDIERAVRLKSFEVTESPSTMAKIFRLEKDNDG